MKILFVETFSWPPHLEISGEIALKLRKEQHEVYYHFIFTKNFDQGISIYGLMKSIIRVFNLLRILKKKGITYTYSFPYFTSSSTKYQLSTLEEVQQYTYKGAGLGMGIASSLNDLINNKKIRSKEINEYADKLIPHSNRIFDITMEQIKAYHPDQLYSFNTRFSSTRPIYEAAKMAHVKIITHESAFHMGKYSVSEESIFDGFANSKKIVKFWKEGDDRKFEISETFFEKLTTMHFDNAKDAEAGIGEYIVPGKLNLVYFPSSIHETYSLGELYPHKLFDSSETAMDFLIDYAGRNPHVNLIVRIHPIIKDKDIDEQKSWEKLFVHKHIKVIHWEDSISSYELVKKADYSMVYHSTIGIEAAYMKCKAIVLGTPWYVSLKCVYTPSSIAELTAALDKGQIEYAYDFSDAIMYGYYVLEHGIPYEYFQPVKGYRGLFCGKDLNKLIS